MDFIKRLFIAMGVGICIILMFLSAQVTHASENHNVKDLNWTWPLEGVISDPFGSRAGHHHGVDIAAEAGTPVTAVDAGEVVRSYHSASYGNVVFISHPNNMETVYAHLKQRFVVEGEQVRQGEKIGEVGNTGRSTGSHLHLEVHNGSWNIDKTSAIDPMLVLNDKPNDQEDRQTVHINEPVVGTMSYHDHHNDDNDDDLPDEWMVDQSEGQVIDIEKGDTLWGYSQQYDVSVEELQEWNDLDSSLIIAGEQLVIHSSAQV